MLFVSFVALAVDRRTNDEKMIDECHHVIDVLITTAIMKIPVRHIMSIMAEVPVKHATMIWHQSTPTISDSFKTFHTFFYILFIFSHFIHLDIGTALHYIIKMHRLHHQHLNMNAHRHITILVPHPRINH